MLNAVVELLSEASAVHACFVYLLEPGAERLVLRAASKPYAHLIGTIALEHGEGLAWWSVERKEPAFIKDEALSDPRFKYVPELAEERFQSLVSVPILGRGESVIGVISLHTEAPREFTEDEVEFLVSSSSLVASAIENARMHAETRHRVRQLELLNRLGERAAAAETREALYEVIVAGVSELVRPGACELYVLDSAAGVDQLTRVASQPAGLEAEDAGPERIGLAELGPELGRPRAEREGTVHVPLRAGGELRGLLVLRAPRDGRLVTGDADIVETAASQGALALVKLELIERLREENAIGELFEALEEGADEGAVQARARAIGLDLGSPHVVLAASAGDAPATWTGQLESALVRHFPGAVVDVRDDELRALVPARGRDAVEPDDGVNATLDELLDGLPASIRIGVSSPCLGQSELRAGLDEAALALKGARVLEGGNRVLGHDELGPYKYLLRLSSEGPERDAHRVALATLAAYDQRRSTSLVQTLEEYLRQRGSISATAEALFVHQNTLRQRLERIEELTGMDVRAGDWLALDIAIRLAALEQDAERVHDVGRVGRREAG